MRDVPTQLTSVGRLIPPARRQLQPHMKAPRTLQISLVWLLSNSLPPLLRDSRLLMTPCMRVLFGHRAYHFCVEDI